VRSNTNLLPTSQPLHGLASLQMTASALLQNLNEKNSLQSYQKSVTQMKSSLLSNQKDSLPAKSRNPANQSSLGQNQGGGVLHTLPNSLNPLIQTSELGMGGNSAMTLMFN